MGPGKVLKKEMKEVLGEKREYLTIKILHNDMTVMVPCENAGMAGLRRVIDEEAVEKVLGVLRDDVSQMPKNWNRRFKHNRDKIKTGDVYELAEVVRNLAIRESEKGLSTGEKQMYTRAKKILAVRADVRARDGGGRGRGAPRQADRGRRTPSARAAAGLPLNRSGQYGGRRDHSRRRQRRTPWGRVPKAFAVLRRAARWSSGAWTCSAQVCDRVVVAVPAGRVQPPDSRAGGASSAPTPCAPRSRPRPRPRVAVVHDAARPLVTRELVALHRGARRGATTA